MSAKTDDDDKARVAEDIKRLNGHAAQLAEHYESVNIIVTRRASDGLTRAISSGKGNWYARYGSTLEWIRGAESQNASADDE